MFDIKLETGQLQKNCRFSDISDNLVQIKIIFCLLFFWFYLVNIKHFGVWFVLFGIFGYVYIYITAETFESWAI